MTTEQMTMNEWKLSFKFLRQHHMKILFHVIYLTFPADLAAASKPPTTQVH